MICGGDELSHTQKGNNNAYCQDNELTWLNWELTPPQQEFLEFVKLATRIRREQPVFQRRKFFQGRKIRGSDIKDLSWFEPNGNEMTDEAWNAGFVKCLGMRLAGDVIGEEDERGEPIIGDTLYCCSMPITSRSLSICRRLGRSITGRSFSIRRVRRRRRPPRRRRRAPTLCKVDPSWSCACADRIRASRS